MLGAVLEPLLDLGKVAALLARQSLAAARCRTQKALDALYLWRRPFDLSSAYSSALATFFVCVAFAPSAPALHAVGAAALALKYWVDKLRLLRLATSSPPALDARVALLAGDAAACAALPRALLAIAVFGHRLT